MRDANQVLFLGKIQSGAGKIKIQIGLENDLTDYKIAGQATFEN